jgi:hypothetical protein
MLKRPPPMDNAPGQALTALCTSSTVVGLSSLAKTTGLS